ncbi:MAG: arginase [Deltaproteobacteria bacterium]|nr:MAG: arginase [Deltaproteobacteria bacterium]
MRETLTLIQAAAWIGQRKEGTNLAPGWLKHRGLLDVLRETFLTIDDLPELRETLLEEEDQIFAEHFSARAYNFPSVAKYNRHLSTLVEEQMNLLNFVLTVGGDHSIALGTLSGVLRANPNTKIIWVDAHTDINTPETSPSGNIHGMPLSFLMKLYQHPMTDEYMDFVPRLDPKNVIVIGARDIDKGEVELITKTGMTVYTSKEVKAYGIETVIKEARKKLDPYNKDPFHISFDVDGIDPTYAPSTGTAVAGGLTLNEAKYLIEDVRRTGRLNSMDLVEINPMLGTQEDLQTTLDTTFSLIQSLKAPESKTKNDSSDKKLPLNLN